MTIDDPLSMRRRRLQFRAWHRGTKEADIMIGSFCDRYVSSWGEAEITWFEALLEEQDVDIMAWAMGRGAAPLHLDGVLLDAFRKLDFMPRPQ